MTTTITEPAIANQHLEVPRVDGTLHRAGTARLLVSCAPQLGALAAVTAFLSRRGAHILEADHHVSDVAGGRAFLRVVFGLAGTGHRLSDLSRQFGAEFPAGRGVDYRFHDAGRRKRVALFVSRQDHCALDLLSRWRSGELPVDIGLVISNHADLADRVAAFGVPFAHVPVSPDTRAEAERRHAHLLANRFDLIVLARYMQIVSGDLLDRLRVPVINIHHSLLPAFVGAGPYRRARQRGVKLIGATAHYVTEKLDEGPIIEQDVARVSHRDSVEDLVRIGADVERVVLARAVRWHCEDRVLVAGNSTVVF